ncbi:hypothetical protein JCM8097_008786 [Rhodosporidiobolus ruineniae]
MGVKGEQGSGSAPQEGKVEAGKCAVTIQFNNNQEELTIKVKTTTPFKKIYNAVATNRGMDVATFRLTHEGRRIQFEDTPESLDFEEEEQVDCHIEQVGGGRA